MDNLDDCAFTSCSVAKLITCDVKVLPDDQRLDRTELESFESVFDTETVFPSVLADFIKVVLNESLLLYEFDIR